MVSHLRRSFSDRRIAIVTSLGVLSMFVIAMIAFQITYVGNWDNLALAWNLFLAIDGFSGLSAFYDVVLFASAALTGLLLGLTSLFFMHAVSRRLVGTFNAWALVVGALALSSFGIYLGRVQRWNSWDVFVRPGSLFGDIAGGLLHPLSHPHPIAVTILFTSFLLASYLLFYSFARRSSLVND